MINAVITKQYYEEFMDAIPYMKKSIRNLQTVHLEKLTVHEWTRHYGPTPLTKAYIGMYLRFNEKFSSGYNPIIPLMISLEELEDTSDKYNVHGVVISDYIRENLRTYFHWENRKQIIEDVKQQVMARVESHKSLSAVLFKESQISFVESVEKVLSSSQTEIFILKAVSTSYHALQLYVEDRSFLNLPGYVFAEISVVIQEQWRYEGKILW